MGFPGSWFRVGETSFQAPLYNCIVLLLLFNRIVWRLFVDFDFEEETDHQILRFAEKAILE